LFAILTTGAIVWQAHRRANRSLADPVPTLPVTADDAPPLETGQDIENQERPLELSPDVRASLERIPADATSRAANPHVLVVPSTPRITPLLPVGEATGVPVVVPGHDPYISSSKSSLLLEYTTAEEVFGFSSKSGAIRPFESDAESEDDEERAGAAGDAADDSEAEPPDSSPAP
jgi:hypothetical protein